MFKACQETLQKLYLQFGISVLHRMFYYVNVQLNIITDTLCLASHAIEGLVYLKNHIKDDTSITLPNVKSTTVELQVHADDDDIVSPYMHPQLLSTLLGRQPSLEELTIIYSVYIDPNQDVSARACESTQMWSDLDDLLSSESSLVYLRSLDVEVIFPNHTVYEEEDEDPIAESLSPNLEEEQAEMANHLKRGVHERLFKTTQRLHKTT